MSNEDPEDSNFFNGKGMKKWKKRRAILGRTKIVIITILNTLFVLYSSFSFVLVAEGQLLWLHQTLLSRSAINSKKCSTLSINLTNIVCNNRSKITRLQNLL